MNSEKRSSNEVFRRQLETRTRDFALAALRLLDGLPCKNSTKVIAWQLGKSATSIGANYQEATRAESRNDFAHKINIALKEAAESGYWFDLLTRLYPQDCVIIDLHRECCQLRNLLQSISNSTRRNTKPTTHNPQPTTHNPQLRTHNPEPTTHNPQPTTQNPQPTTQPPPYDPS